MFILYGLSERDVVVRAGTFDCPTCRRRTYCRHRKIETWLTAFFVPICAWEVVSEYCQCDECRRSFTSPIHLPFLPAGGHLRSDLKAEIESGAPIEPVIERLRSSGIDPVTVCEVLCEIAGTSRSLCPPCGLSYLGGVATCRNCGGDTVKAPAKEGDWPDDLA